MTSSELDRAARSNGHYLLNYFFFCGGKTKMRPSEKVPYSLMIAMEADFTEANVIPSEVFRRVTQEPYRVIHCQQLLWSVSQLVVKLGEDVQYWSMHWAILCSGWRLFWRANLLFSCSRKWWEISDIFKKGSCCHLPFVSGMVRRCALKLQHKNCSECSSPQKSSKSLQPILYELFHFKVVTLFMGHTVQASCPLAHW